MRHEKFVVILSSYLLLVLGSGALGQIPDLQSRTLSLVDVTAKRVNQTVPEDTDENEKEIAFGDYDNDGDLDIVIAIARGDFGERRNKLYRNDGGVLTEVSGEPVIADFAMEDVSRGALFRDFDNDGWLDLVIANDSNSGTNSHTSPGRTRYYRNVGGLMFVNETERLNDFNGGVSHAASADLNGDGLDDIVLCNHPFSNQDRIAFNGINDLAPGEFQDFTNTHIPVDNEYGKHVEIADMNGDGQLDILMASHVSDDSFIYYNNNNDAGSGIGDFRYGGIGASTTLPTASGGILERALVPGDFNNDGRMDFYFSNEGSVGPNLTDAIYVNTGNDANNKAVFAPQLLSSELSGETMKGTVADLDGDRRADLVVMTEGLRPYIFRNTSENGEVSFIEWTPAAINGQHDGWHARVGNLTGDSRADLFVGAKHDDYLFENVSQIISVDELLGGTILPEFHAEAPIGVTGTVEFGATRQLIATNMPGGAHVSVLMRSLGDLNISVTQADIEIASSNRSGHGTDEAIEFVVPTSGNVIFEIGVDGLSFDGNGDGQIDLLDIGSFVDCLNGVSTDCDPFDVNDNGQLSLLLVQPFIESVSSTRSSEEFVIEFLSRQD